MSTNPFAPLYGPVYGSFFFGTIMTTAFYGVTCMQTFFYYVHYQNDPSHLKILVAVLWVLDTIHQALAVAGAYKYIMAGLLNPLSILTGNPELVLVYLLTALVATPTQGFFVYRLYTFSGHNIVAPIIWAVLALASLVSATVYVAKALYSANGSVHVVPFASLNSGIFVSLGYVCLSIAAGVDILIAIFMTYLLFRERAGTGYARTAHILQRLTVFAVNTGIWTATFAILTIILLHLFPSDVYYAVFIIPLCSVYCNTILANLNARSYLKVTRTSNGFSTDLSGTTLSLRMSDRAQVEKQRADAELVPSEQPGVWKTTEVVKFIDGNPSSSTDNV